MRTIERSTIFKKDYKRESKGKYQKSLDNLLIEAITLIANDKSLGVKYRDHALSGNWDGHRECHLKPDLLLIYKKPSANVLQLVRLGSHSNLFSSKKK
ncbi:type II toxin-antitoxin system YafQ family toxin [Thiotrichales bacterium 19X7-9]|nr:type II toxin-antitoxin system YafQ family toxin [Thiotrichales bacterium 19X7-9]